MKHNAIRSQTTSTIASRSGSAVSKNEMKAIKPQKRKSYSLDEFLEMNGLQHNFSDKSNTQFNESTAGGLSKAPVSEKDGKASPNDLAVSGDALGHRVRYQSKHIPTDPSNLKPATFQSPPNITNNSVNTTSPTIPEKNGIYDRLHSEKVAKSLWVPVGTSEGEMALQSRMKSKATPHKAGMEAAKRAQEKKLLARVAWSIDQNPSGPPPRMARSQKIGETGGIVQCSKDLGINCKEGTIALDPHKTKVLVGRENIGVLYNFLGDKVPMKNNMRKVLDVDMVYRHPLFCDETMHEGSAE